MILVLTTLYIYYFIPYNISMAVFTHACKISCTLPFSVKPILFLELLHMNFSFLSFYQLLLLAARGISLKYLFFYFFWLVFAVDFHWIYFLPSISRLLACLSANITPDFSLIRTIPKPFTTLMPSISPHC